MYIENEMPDRPSHLTNLKMKVFLELESYHTINIFCYYDCRVHEKPIDTVDVRIVQSYERTTLAHAI